MSELVVADVVGSELEAVLVCSILRDAGVQCMHRITNFGSGAMDGLATGGPREVVVYAEQLPLARRVIDEHRGGPGPTPAGDDRETETEQPADAVAQAAPASEAATAPSLV
jgi:hypothetical protein